MAVREYLRQFDEYLEREQALIAAQITLLEGLETPPQDLVNQLVNIWGTFVDPRIALASVFS